MSGNANGSGTGLLVSYTIHPTGAASTTDEPAPPPSTPPRETTPDPVDFSSSTKASTSSPLSVKTLAKSDGYSAIKHTLAKEQQKYEKMTIEGKIFVISYDEMMSVHVPSPVAGDCTDGDLISELVREKYKAMSFKPECVMYNVDGPLSKTVMDQGQWLSKDGEHGFYINIHPHKNVAGDTSNRHVDAGMYQEKPGVPRPEETDRLDWDSVEVAIEYKTGTDHDPIDELADDAAGSAEKRKAVLGQITNYASIIFERQHRTHHFTLLVMGRHARILRWDRSGVLATQKFDYVDKPELLARFLWRYARLSEEQRGHDSTVKRLSPEDRLYKLISNRVKHPEKYRNQILCEHAWKAFVKSVKNKRPRYLVKVHDATLKDDPEHFFVIGDATFAAPGLAGRGTRGFVAVEVEERDGKWSLKPGYAWLKDCWRVAHDGIEREGDILRKLNDANVVGVPTLVCHGDVDGQRTRSQEPWFRRHPDKQPKNCPFKTLVHYRMVVAEVCLPLSFFASGKELLKFIIDCIRAHYHAWKKGIIHRDISAGNVLIKVTEYVEDGVLKERRSGVLCDWELSTKVSVAGETGEPRAIDRTGTWQFLSAGVLMNPSKVVTVADEIESFFHVLIWYAVRYLPHNCVDVGNFVHQYFDGWRKVPDNPTYYCGKEKLRAMKTGQLELTIGGTLKFYWLQLVPSESAPALHPLTVVMERLLEIFQSHYTLNYVEETFAPVTGSRRAQTAVRARAAATDWDAWIDEVEQDISPSFLKKTETRVTWAPDPDQEWESGSEYEVERELEPTQQAHQAKMQEDANMLQRHEAILALLVGFIKDPKLVWPEEDWMEDQLPEDYRGEVDMDAPIGKGSKRTSEAVDEVLEQDAAKRQKLERQPSVDDEGED